VGADQAVRMWSTEFGSYSTLLAGAEAPGPLELWSWRLMPGDASSSDAHPPGTTELIHVQSGELTLVVDGEEYRLASGTSASFESHVAHSYRNDGDVPVEMTMAVSVPPPRLT
ncbi:MAG: cupin domain-containing protein, partial [Acidimicrobiales bacterium]